MDKYYASLLQEIGVTFHTETVPGDYGQYGAASQRCIVAKQNNEVIDSMNYELSGDDKKHTENTLAVRVLRKYHPTYK